ncbi:MAG: PepSY domain-containing protein [Caldilineales bacterium]|nr:PepSY domain-containing protein [Caldilineales bacterium]
MRNKDRWLLILGFVLLVLALIIPASAFAQGGGPGQTPCTQNGSGWQGGMMGRIASMMTGSGCDARSNAWSGGMMGGFYNNQSGPRITLDEAIQIAERYAQNYTASSPLEVKEVMEFEHNFYAEIVESDSGIGAFEILIDPVSGFVHPEPGPNMMWNTKYGMHSGFGGMMGRFMGEMMGGWQRPSGEMSVTPEQAIAQAQDYLDQSMPGLTVGDEVDQFYGYYTLHTLKDGEIEGMLSVNGSTGQAWYHGWHGDFLGMSGDEHI